MGRRARRLVTALAIAAVLCGSASAGVGAKTPAQRGADQACAPGRQAVVHRGGGSPLKGRRPTFTVCAFPVGARALEPTFGVTASGAVLYQAAARSSVPFTDTPAVLRSGDGGRSWDDVSPVMHGARMHPATVDPYLHVDPDTGRIFTVDAMVGCAMVSTSDDDGGTWTSVPALCGAGVDHQSVVTGPPVSSPTSGYPNLVYWCAVHGGGGQFSTTTACSKSLDGGLTFVPTGAPPYTVEPGAADGNFGVAGWCDGLAGRAVVGSDGTLFVPKGWCGRPTLAISTDEGTTWSREEVPGGLGMARTRDDRPDHEAHAAVDRLGNLYFVWAGRDRLPYLAVRDSAGSWSEPVMVAPPGLVEADRPHVAVGEPGHLSIAYMGSATSPGDPFPGEGSCSPTEGAADFLVSCAEPPAYRDVMWHGYLTMTTGALGGDPDFSSITATDAPLRQGACGPGGCGDLGDGIASTAIDTSGRVLAAFADFCAEGCGQGGEAQGLFVVAKRARARP